MQCTEQQEFITEQRGAEGGNTRLPLLTSRQRAILAGVLADERRLANLPTGRDIGLSGDELGRRRLAVRDAQAGLVPMNLGGWLGRAPSNSDCVLCCREYARLEGMGLLERHNPRGGRRTSHLKLTPAGRRVAEQFLPEEEEDADGTAEPLDLNSLELLPIDISELCVAETDATASNRVSE